MRDFHQEDEWKRNRKLDEWESDTVDDLDDLDPEELLRADDYDPEEMGVGEKPPELTATEKQRDTAFSKRPKMLMRAVIAAALLLITVLLFQYPLNAKLSELVQNTFERDTNFAMVRDWMENAVGKGNPTMLPAFSPKNGNSMQNATPVQTQPIAPVFDSPVKGNVLAGFSDKNPGVVLETAGKAPVKAAADGEITRIGKVDDWDNVVVLRHTDGSETWYQGLEDVTITPNLKVKKGDLLGNTSENGGKYLVSIFYYKDHELKNPADVIPFAP